MLGSMFSADPPRQNGFVTRPKKCKARGAIREHASHSSPYFQGLLLPSKFQSDNHSAIKMRGRIEAAAFDTYFCRVRLNHGPFNWIENLHQPPKQIARSHPPLGKPLASVQSSRERIN
jgi:hypothetical protein